MRVVIDKCVSALLLTNFILVLTFHAQTLHLSAPQFFVRNLASPFMFYLCCFRNDGKGRFRDVTEAWWPPAANVGAGAGIPERLHTGNAPRPAGAGHYGAAIPKVEAMASTAVRAAEKIRAAAIVVCCVSAAQ